MSSELSSQVIDERIGGGTERGSLSASVRLLSTAALVGVATTAVIFGALHLLPPTSDISPVRRTISEYALTSSAWAFNVAVVALALATVAVLAGAVRLQRVPMVSVATLCGALWVAGLLTLVSFPKHNWALGGPSTSGQVHRLASLVAFLALPIAAMAIARRRPNVRNPVAARLAFWLAALSLLWFTPLIVAIIRSPRAWWQAIPLGLVERGMAVTEVAAIVALALVVRSPERSLSGPAPTPAR